MNKSHFDWDENKNLLNQAKHGVSFEQVQHAFADPKRVILKDINHSHTESRFHCFGWVDGDIMTVRFTYRKKTIRIIGAAYWRKGRKIYEQENNTH